MKHTQYVVEYCSRKQPELCLWFSSHLTNVFYNRSCVCVSAHTWQHILQPELCLCFSSHLTTYSTIGAVFVFQLTSDNVFYNRSCVCASAHTWQTYSTTGAVFVFQLTYGNVFYNRSCVCASAQIWQRILLLHVRQVRHRSISP